MSVCSEDDPEKAAFSMCSASTTHCVQYFKSFFFFFLMFTERENIVLETPGLSATRTVPVVLGTGFGFSPCASQTSDMLVWALGPSVWPVVLSRACQRFKWASKVPGGSSTLEAW